MLALLNKKAKLVSIYSVSVYLMKDEKRRHLKWLVKLLFNYSPGGRIKDMWRLIIVFSLW